MQNNNFNDNNLVAGANAAPTKYKSFSNFMQTVGTKLVENTLTDPKRRAQFIANVISAVSTNPTLQECDQASVVSAALQAEVLHFPVSNSLGYVYLVPYKESEYNAKTRKREVVRTVAQFQIGYKGYIQLAIRSGQYKNIDVCEVREGELIESNPLEGYKFNFCKDYKKRKNLKVVGYVGQLELVNGFKKQMYFDFEEILDHANTYSKAFDKEEYERLLNGDIDPKEAWKFSSFWYKDFDEMAKKTVLRQMLSKWGIMSVELQSAYNNDQQAFDANQRGSYIDSKEFNITQEIISKQQDEENGSIQPPTEEPNEEEVSNSQEEDFISKMVEKYGN